MPARPEAQTDERPARHQRRAGRSFRFDTLSFVSNLPDGVTN
jgi:hypothetical protein